MNRTLCLLANYRILPIAIVILSSCMAPEREQTVFGEPGPSGGGVGGAGYGGMGGTATGGAGGVGGTGGTGGAGGTGSGGGTSGTGGAPPQCIQMTMKQLPGGFSIDATEVTQCQYKAWLDTVPTTAGQSGDCTWNTSFAPAQVSCISRWNPSVTPNLPVDCVDWCDATAYCLARQERLCSSGEWLAACSSNGSLVFPYGNTYETATCNGKDAPGSGPVNAASKTGCQSDSAGYQGVFDLSGNMGEWDATCSGGSCSVRGGSYGAYQSYLRCDSQHSSAIDDTLSDIGFRCCKD